MYGNITRFLRMIAMFITLFTPAIYIAITNYHEEMLSTDLLLAIAGAREMVPFPAIFELLLLELAFELIREAGKPAYPYRSDHWDCRSINFRSSRGGGKCG